MRDGEEETREKKGSRSKGETRVKERGGKKESVWENEVEENKVIVRRVKLESEF